MYNVKKALNALNIIEIFTSKICGGCTGLFESQVFKTAHIIITITTIENYFLVTLDNHRSLSRESMMVQLYSAQWADNQMQWFN